MFRTAAIVGAVSLFGTLPASAQFNINDAYVANESGQTGVNPFVGPAGGQITLGYNLTPTTPATFSTANLAHSDAFNGSAGVEGFYIANSALVPAVLVNTQAGPTSNSTNFGATLLPGQILLHPGSTNDNAFDQPASAAVLRYTVPSSGLYSITGNFSSLSGGVVAVDVLVDGTSILTAGAGSDATPFAQTVNLTGGQLLDFVVDDTGNIGSDSTGLQANVALVPEPTMLATASIGLVLLCRRRRGTGGNRRPVVTLRVAVPPRAAVHYIRRI